VPDKHEEEKKPLPPGSEIVILRNILAVAEQSLKELQEQGKTQNATLIELKEQGKTLDQTLVTLNESLKVQQDSKILLQKLVEEVTPPPVEEHTYTIVVRQINMLTRKYKETKDMAIEAGKPRAFGANMQDNGNNIPLPDGSKFTWTTDNTADQISVSADSTTAVITTPAGDSGRTSVTVTAAAVDPDGNMASGSVTVPVIPGVGHTFTVSVAELQVNPLPGKPAPKK